MAKLMEMCMKISKFRKEVWSAAYNGRAVVNASEALVGKRGGIYLMWNLINRKCYVGKTKKDFMDRLRGHWIGKDDNRKKKNKFYRYLNVVGFEH